MKGFLKNKTLNRANKPSATDASTSEVPLSDDPWIRLKQTNSNHKKWSPELVQATLRVFKKTLDQKALVDLDRRLRYGTGAQLQVYKRCGEENEGNPNFKQEMDIETGNDDDDGNKSSSKLKKLSDNHNNHDDDEDDDDFYCAECEAADINSNNISNILNSSQNQNNSQDTNRLSVTSQSPTAFNFGSGDVEIGACCPDPNCGENEEKDSKKKKHSRKNCPHLYHDDKVDDAVSRLLNRYLSDIELIEAMPEILNTCATMFNNIRSKAKQEAEDQFKKQHGVSYATAGANKRKLMQQFDIDSDPEAAKMVRHDLLKETLIRTIVKRIEKENRSRQEGYSHEGGLLATPQGYTGGSLDYLTTQLIQDVFNPDPATCKGYGYMDNFFKNEQESESNMNEISSILDKAYDEMEMMQHNCKFQMPMSQEIKGERKDRLCYRGLEDLDREKERGLNKLFHRLIALPFELNKKVPGLNLQATGNFQLAMYPGNGSFYRKHLDSGYCERDNGRKITVILYLNKGSTERDYKERLGKLRVYKRRKNVYEVGESKYKEWWVAGYQKKDGEGKSKTKACSDPDSESCNGNSKCESDSKSKDSADSDLESKAVTTAKSECVVNGKTEISESDTGTKKEKLLKDDDDDDNGIQVTELTDDNSNTNSCTKSHCHLTPGCHSESDSKSNTRPPDEVVEDIEPRHNRLVMFRSRDIPHEVLENKGRARYAISMYICGPAGPGDHGCTVKR